MDQDPRIDQILAITKDTNRMVHKMHRGVLWGRFFTVAWWILIVAVSGYTYFAYAQPYVTQIEKMYAQLGQSTRQAQSIQSEMSNFFGNLMTRPGGNGATSSTNTKH